VGRPAHSVDLVQRLAGGGYAVVLMVPEGDEEWSAPLLDQLREGLRRHLSELGAGPGAGRLQAMRKRVAGTLAKRKGAKAGLVRSGATSEV
jgi:hypothetical protein